MKRYLILFFVLMVTIYIKSRNPDFYSHTPQKQRIEQLQNEIKEFKKTQEDKLAFEKTFR